MIIIIVIVTITATEKMQFYFMSSFQFFTTFFSEINFNQVHWPCLIHKFINTEAERSNVIEKLKKAGNTPNTNATQLYNGKMAITKESM